MNLGVDTFKECATPKRYDPGIGLRPGGERHDIESLVPIFFAALYESIAAHSRLGLNVVVDVGHHDAYAVPRGILADSARRLNGLPVLLVGVRCPIDIIMQRRRNTGWQKGSAADSPVPGAIRWQREVHKPGIYDLQVDTSLLSPEECVQVIRRHIQNGPAPSAIQRLAAMSMKRD